MSQYFITRADLISRFGITFSNTHLLYLESIDAFPKRIALSPRRKVWNEAEIVAFLDQCQEERGTV